MDNAQPMASENSVPQPAQPPELVSAGFWIRGGAYMVDGILLTIAQTILLAVCGLFMPQPLCQALNFLLVIAYFTWMPVAYQGQTLGKMAAGIAIVRTDLTPLTYLRCLSRWVGYLISGILLGLGFIIAAFTKNKRGLHDYIVDTRVIYIKEISTGRKAALIALGIIFPLIFAAVIIGGVLSGTRLSDSSSKMNESLTQSNLKIMRTAIAAYQADNNNTSPTDMALVFPKYLQEPSMVRIKDHPETDQFQSYGADACAGASVDGSKIADSGKWGYVSDSKASCFGALFVDCTHNDSEGKPWFSY